MTSVARGADSLGDTISEVVEDFLRGGSKTTRSALSKTADLTETVGRLLSTKRFSVP